MYYDTMILNVEYLLHPSNMIYIHFRLILNIGRNIYFISKNIFKQYIIEVFTKFNRFYQLKVCILLTKQNNVNLPQLNFKFFPCDEQVKLTDLSTQNNYKPQK